jgi:hypothetical protein
MKELVEYIAKSMVTDPDAVEVAERQSRHAIYLRLIVAQDDMGRVIGKQGRMANAMRTLLHVAAVKEGKRVSLEIGD